MSDLLLGLGMVLAAVGPILLLPLLWLVYKFVYRPLLGARIERARGVVVARNAGWLLSIALVTVVLVLSYLPGRHTFDALCAAEAVPKVHQRVSVAGFYRTKMFPYEALGYLSEGKFQFVEAPDPYRKGELRRYRLAADGTPIEEKITQLQSRYGVEKLFTELRTGVTVSRKRIYDLSRGETLARAAQIDYSGGPLAILFGVYAMRSCPDVRDAVGSEQFRIHYELEQHVLGGSAR